MGKTFVPSCETIPALVDGFMVEMWGVCVAYAGSHPG